MKTKLYSILLAAVSLAIVGTAQAQSVAGTNAQCINKNFCNKEDLGDSYDYRGQSTFGRLAPGDTTRVKVVFYSKNDVRVLVCNDPSLGAVKFRVIKTVREYNRVVDRVEKTVTEEPIYKLDKSGNPIQQVDDWGSPKTDEYGDPVFEVASYKENVRHDTIWKTERNIREEVLFDSQKSKSGQTFFEQAIEKTQSVVVEVVVPADETKKNYEGCVAIMIGRKLHAGDYKKFGKGN